MMTMTTMMMTIMMMITMTMMTMTTIDPGGSQIVLGPTLFPLRRVTRDEQPDI